MIYLRKLNRKEKANLMKFFIESLIMFVIASIGTVIWLSFYDETITVIVILKAVGSIFAVQFILYNFVRVFIQLFADFRLANSKVKLLMIIALLSGIYRMIYEIRKMN